MSRLSNYSKFKQVKWEYPFPTFIHTDLEYPVVELHWLGLW